MKHILKSVKAVEEVEQQRREAIRSFVSDACVSLMGLGRTLSLTL